MKSKKIATFGLLTTLCLILSYVEILIPLNFAIPGVKLGLSNIVVMMALYLMDLKSAFFINIVRIFLNGILFSNPITMAYSFAGGMLSLLAMVIVKKINSLSIISVSITGGIFHNVGQILMACFYLGSSKVLYYLPVLFIFAVITGVLTGIIATIVVERIKNK